MAKTNYWKADAIKQVAEKLIIEFHQEINDYKIRVDFWFTDKVTKRNGKAVWGLCKKVSGFNAVQAANNEEGEEFYAIIIPQPIWDALSEQGKEALVYHELCHILVEYDSDEEGDASGDAIKKKVAPHDLEEFVEVMRKYPNWQDAEVAVHALMNRDDDEIEEDE